jgi:hypothetical protein
MILTKEHYFHSFSQNNVNNYVSDLTEKKSVGYIPGVGKGGEEGGGNTFYWHHVFLTAFFSV